MEEVILLVFLGVFLMGLVMLYRPGKRSRPTTWARGDMSPYTQPLPSDGFTAGVVAAESTGHPADVSGHHHHHHDVAYNAAATFDGLAHEGTHQGHHDIGSGDASHHDSGFDIGHHDSGFDAGGGDGGGFDAGGGDGGGFDAGGGDGGFDGGSHHGD